MRENIKKLRERIFDRSKSQKDSEGFTIIEVLIVLAIAGLILLIVFLAVPALQRSSRNTQRKNDASSVLGAVSNYISNNNGQVPQSISTGAQSNEVEVCGSSCSSGNSEEAKVGYYGNTDVSLTTSPPSSFPGISSMVILVGYTCPDTAGTLPASAQQNSRTAVALFALKSGSSTNTNECQEQ